MTPLQQYDSLLNALYSALRIGNWPDVWPGIVVTANRLWERLSDKDRERVAERQEREYQRLTKE